MEIGVEAPLVLEELIQEVKEWEDPAVVTAAVVGAAQLVIPLPPPPLPPQPPLWPELGTIRRERAKQGNGVGEEKDREHREDLHPVVEIREMGAGLTAVKVALDARHLMLKMPYRTCSAGLIWTLGFCPTQAGDKHRSDKTRPGTLKNIKDKIKEDHHQLYQNTHLL